LQTTPVVSVVRDDQAIRVALGMPHPFVGPAGTCLRLG
jgi:hypothetical protein